MKEESKKRIDGDIDSALLKKALGFDATEIVEEYALSEGGEVKLSKKKITKKTGRCPAAMRGAAGPGG